MSSTTPQYFVVCSEHSLRYSAAGRCPDCDELGPSGVDYSTTTEVQIIETEVGE